MTKTEIEIKNMKIRLEKMRESYMLTPKSVKEAIHCANEIYDLQAEIDAAEKINHK